MSSFDKLKAKSDAQFNEWLQKQFFRACSNEKRFKHQLDTTRGVYEYKKAKNVKRCCRQAMEYKDISDKYQTAIHSVGEHIAKAMERGEIHPATYKFIMDTLQFEQNDEV